MRQTMWRPPCELCACVLVLMMGVGLMQAQEKPKPVPSVKDILSRYTQAVGGERAVRAHTTRVIKGALVTGGGEAPLEIKQKAPDKFVVMMDTPGGRTWNGFDGRIAWSKNAGGVQDREGADIDYVRRERYLHREADWRTLYPTMSEPKEGELDGRRVFVLEASSAGGQVETQYFDAEKGWLAGLDVTVRGTKLSVRYADYRLVDDVWLPFSVVRARPDFRWTEKYSTITHDVVLDDAEFAKPAALEARMAISGLYRLNR